MTHRASIKTQALTDQILAVLNSSEGFPLSTNEIADRLGDRLTFLDSPMPVLRAQRPSCWPADFDDPGRNHEAFCHRCKGFHRDPVWRRYYSDDVRPLLNRLAAAGRVEKVVPEGQRKHYWRGS